MPPLILHNVPDEELYVGEDGIQRPYAMVFPGYAISPTLPFNAMFLQDQEHGFPREDSSFELDHSPNPVYRVEPQHNTRSRKPVPETGSFGRSVRRSRSKTGTPARKEDPNLAIADSIFTSYVSNLSKKQPTRRSSTTADRPDRALVRTDSRQTVSFQDETALTKAERETEQEQRSLNRPAHIHNVPTEVILRGYHDAQQYAALSHFETLAGRILEDYPRDPPITQRRFKSDLRDATALRPRPLTEEERRKAMAFAGGENWIKITFESEDAAETAIEESPQEIGGFLVFAERYRGVAPTNQDAIPAAEYRKQQAERRRSTATTGANGRRGSDREKSMRPYSTLPRSHAAGGLTGKGGLFDHQETPESETTQDSGTTYDSQGAGLAVKRPFTDPTETRENEVYCRRIPTAKRLQLLPASDALLPKQSFSQKILSKIPLIKWVTSDIIGSQVPRTEDGEFNWAAASFYWLVMAYLDMWLRVFGGDIVGNNKEE